MIIPEKEFALIIKNLLDSRTFQELYECTNEVYFAHEESENKTYSTTEKYGMKIDMYIDELYKRYLFNKSDGIKLNKYKSIGDFVQSYDHPENYES